MDYNNFKKIELIELVRGLKKEIQSLKEKLIIENFLSNNYPYSYIKFDKNGFIKYSNNSFIFDNNLNCLRYKSLKELKTTDNKTLADYFNIWINKGINSHTINLKYNNSNEISYKCSFIKLDNTNYICVFLDISELMNLQRSYEISEKKFKQLYDDLKIGICILDRNFQIIYANKKMKEYFPNIIENSGLICYETFNKPSRNGPCTYCPCIKTLKDGKSHNTITETPSGNTIRYFDLKSSPIKNNDNEVTYIIEYVEDITDKISKEQSINFQNIFLQYLVDSIPASIFYKDLNLKYKGCNKIFSEFFNLKPNEIINKTAYDLYSKETAERFEELDKEILKTKKNQILEYNQKNNETGKEEYFLLHKAPYYDLEGNLSGIIGVILNITKLKEIEHELQESSAFINELIEQTNSIVLNLDLEGTIKIFNNAAEKITGYKREEVIGKNWYHIFVSPKKYPDVFEIFKGFINRGQITENYTNYIVTKTGEERLIRWKNYPLKKYRKVTGVISIGIDITDERGLTSDKLLNVFEIIQHPVIITNERLIIEYANSAFKNMTGFSPDDVIGKKYNVYKSDNVNKDKYSEMINTITKGIVWSGKYLAEKKDGNQYYENVIITPIHNSKGKISNFIIEIQETKEDDESLNNRHNLKSEIEILTVLQDSINILLKREIKKLSDNFKNKEIKPTATFCKHTSAQIEYLNNLLATAEELFKKNYIDESESTEKVDLSSIIEDILTKNKINLNKENVRFIPQSHREKFLVNVNNEIIKFVIEEIIIAMNDLSEKGSLEIKLKKIKNKSFSINVSGKIKKSLEGNIITLKSILSNKGIVTSENLSIKIILLSKILNRLRIKHNFEIISKNRLMIKIHFENDNITDIKVNKEKKIRKILLAEDNISNAELIQIYLGDKFHIDYTTSIKDTIDNAINNNYDMFIIDIDLGNEKDGILILEELKKNEKYENTPFIAVTGFSDFKDREYLLECGFSDYLSKPFRKEQLISLINKYI